MRTLSAFVALFLADLPLFLQTGAVVGVVALLRAVFRR